MEDKYRFLTTAVIWVMVTVILLGVVFTVAAANAELPVWVGVGVFAFIFSLIIIAGISTRTIWRAGYETLQAGQTSGQPGEKVKRVDDSLLARLVDDLSPDEVVELETLLLAREDWPDQGNQAR